MSLFIAYQIYLQNKYWMNRQEENNQKIFNDLMEVVQTKEDRKDLSKCLYSFIRSNPSQTQIIEIGTAITKKKKELLHYHDITDLLIVIIKLLYNISKQENLQASQEKFKAKFEQIKDKLKKEEVNKWIEGLKKQIYRLTKEKNSNYQKRKHQIHQLAEDLKDARQQNDKQIQNIKNIALCFYEHSQIQTQMKDSKLHLKIIQEINKLKQQKDINQAKKRQQIEISKKLQSISNKWSFKCEKGIEIIDKIQKFILEINTQKEFLKKRLQDFKASNTQKENQIAELIIKIQKYQSQIKSQQNKIVQNQQLSQEQILSKTFLLESSIVSHKNQLQQIVFLKKSINQLVKIDGARCKLLYSSSQPKSKQNFHEYFDNLPNILLLIKLKTGPIIGGFSHEQFKQNCSGKLGFLFNLSIMQTYELSKRSTITYDSYYIIFGNSQICIEVKKMNLFSNFGISSAHFDCKGKNIDSFLNNQGKRDVQMEAYQILQVQTQ